MQLAMDKYSVALTLYYHSVTIICIRVYQKTICHCIIIVIIFMLALH